MNAGLQWFGCSHQQGFLPIDRKGVPHHLLGTVSPNVEFTAKDFRDSAIPLINDILSRNCLSVIVGGTNYYIQGLDGDVPVKAVREVFVVGEVFFIELMHPVD